MVTILSQREQTADPRASRPAPVAGERIAAVRALPLRATVTEGWTTRFGAEESLNTLVEVVSESGVVGLGSSFTSGVLVEASLTLLRPLLIGASALDPAAVAETLHQQTFWQGRGGAVTHAISGVDIALWDLFGKLVGQPVSRLLGGRFRERIKPYASLLMAEPAAMRERLQAALGRGFRAFKIGWGPFGRGSARADEAIIAAAREAVGPEVELMVDAGASDAFWPHGSKWALTTARMLREHDVTWFEEPLPPDDLAGYARLTEHAPLPIAGGEVLTRRQAFNDWIERRAVDYLQPDVCKCGGITEQHRIGQAADDHGILVVGHGWNTAVGLAADLQLAAAATRARWVEYTTPSPYIDGLIVDPPRLDAEGLIAIPDGPGLGLRWNHDAIAALTGGARPTA